MTIGFGDGVPDFTAKTTAGSFRFHDWLGNSWAMLFVHPAVPTAAGTSELAALARHEAEFARRHVRPIALAPAGLEALEHWLEDVEETQGIRPTLPVIADPERELYARFGLVSDAIETAPHPVFLIGPDKLVHASLAYPASTAYASTELLRLVDSVLLTIEHAVATPAGWTPGADVLILPSVSAAEAERRFPGGWRQLKDYLKVVPQPR